MVQVHVPDKGVGVQLPPRAPDPGETRDFLFSGHLVARAFGKRVRGASGYHVNFSHLDNRRGL